MPSTSVSTPRLAQIEAWDVANQYEHADYWETIADAWEDAVAAVHARIADTAWRGRGRDAALDRADGDVMRMRKPIWALRDAAKTARHSAGNQYAAQQRALEAVDEARSAGFEVGEDLTVSAFVPGRSAAQAMALQPTANEMAVEIRTHALDLATLDHHSAVNVANVTAVLHYFAFPPETPGNVSTPHRSNTIQAANFKQSPNDSDDWAPSPDSVAAWYVEWEELQREIAAHNAAVLAHLRVKPPSLPNNHAAIVAWNARLGPLNARMEQLYAKQQQLAADAVQLGIPEPTVTPPVIADDPAQVPSQGAVPSGLVSVKAPDGKVLSI